MRPYFDFHLHTAFSDGSDTPEELISTLRKNGISAFSVTDHDTADACTVIRELLPSGMTFLTGIEFSCRSKAGKHHILGYHIDPQNRLLQDAVEAGRKLRRQKLTDRLTYLETVHGITFTDEELRSFHSSKSVGKPHLAKAMVQRGIASSIDEAIKKYINGCRSADTRIDAACAITAISASGGIPVWAHPLGGEGEPRLTPARFEEQLEELRSLGIRGLECYYSRYNRSEIDYLLEHAHRFGLYVSAGSDYHGTNKNIPVGTLNADGFDVPREAVTLPVDSV